MLLPVLELRDRILFGDQFADALGLHGCVGWRTACQCAVRCAMRTQMALIGYEVTYNIDIGSWVAFGNEKGGCGDPGVLPMSPSAARTSM